MLNRAGKPFFYRLMRVLGLRIGFLLLNLVDRVLLARIVGQAEYGIFAYAIALLSFLSIPAQLGFDRLLVREVAIYASQSKWDLLKGLLYWSNLSVLLISVAIALVAMGIVWGLKPASVEPAMMLPLALSFLYLPIGALRSLRLSAMKGLNHVTWGMLPETVLAPLLFLGFLGLGYWLLPTQITAAHAVGMYLLTTLITFMLGATLLHRFLPPSIREAVPVYTPQAWTMNALPMMVVGGLQIIHARIDMVMLGAIQPVTTVAIYSAVYQGVQMVNLVLLSANNLLAPNVARLYADGEIPKLQNLVVGSARMVTGLASVMAIALMIFGRPYLNLFGPEYIDGWGALIALCLAQIVNAATGSVGVLLNMTGHERHMVSSVGISALLNILLNAFLIPLWGLNGAAIATFISLSFINILKAIWVHRALGINATCFGRRKAKGGRE